MASNNKTIIHTNELNLNRLKIALAITFAYTYYYGNNLDGIYVYKVVGRSAQRWIENELIL